MIEFLIALQHYWQYNFLPPWTCNTEASKIEGIIHVLYCHVILFCYVLHHYLNMTIKVMTVSLNNVYSHELNHIIQAQKIVKKPYGHAEWFVIAACRYVVTIG